MSKNHIIVNLTDGRFEYVDIKAVMDGLLMFANEQQSLKRSEEAMHHWLRIANELCDTASPKASTPDKPLSWKHKLLKPFFRVAAVLGRPQVAFNSAVVRTLNEAMLPLFHMIEKQSAYNQAVAQTLMKYDSKKILDIITYLDKKDEGMRLGLQSLEDWLRSLQQQLEEMNAFHKETVGALADKEQVGQVQSDLQSLNNDVKNISNGLQFLGIKELGDRVHVMEENMTYFRQRVDEMLVAVSALAQSSSRGSGASDGQANEPSVTKEDIEDLRRKNHDDDYVVFEHVFRGTDPEMRAKVAPYADFLADCERVVDLGCGRGEMLEALEERDVQCLGVDMNSRMIEVCKAKGLHVEEANIFDFLDSQPKQSFDGVVSMMVVEHLTGDEILEFLRKVRGVLKPGGKLIIETQNPASVWALCQHFTKDVDHETAIHPSAFEYLLKNSGFKDVRIEPRSPVHENAKLSLMPVEGLEGPMLRMAQAHNENVRKLNSFVYGDQDYAVYAVKM